MVMNMQRVGVRESKTKLSAYLRLVEAGETLIVTDRHRDVAEIRKPGSKARGQTAYEEMVANGEIIPPTEPQDFSWLEEQGPVAKLPPGWLEAHFEWDRADWYDRRCNNAKDDPE